MEWPMAPPHVCAELEDSVRGRPALPVVDAGLGWIGGDTRVPVELRCDNIIGWARPVRGGHNILG